MSSTSETEPELSYFDGPGRANLTRLAFVAGGTNFKDNRIANWPEVKSNPSSTPAQLFGSLPVIKHGDLLLAASTATAMYAADLGSLMGTSVADRAVCMMLVATNEDLKCLMYNCLFGDEDSKAAGRTALPTAVVKFLSGVERILERKNSAGPYFLGGDAPSLADLAVFDNVYSPFPGLRALEVDLTPYPKLVACADAVAASPSVATYVANGWK